MTAISRLTSRGVRASRGRTSRRLEPELWNMLEEICQRETLSMGVLVRRIEKDTPSISRTSAVRVHIANYFRTASTEAGHAHVGHGLLPIL
jgi:predicted DNA-binding ribbon-helix-helix protein